MTYSFISAAEFTNLIQTDPAVDVLDIRSTFEHDAYKLNYPAQHIPLHEIDPDILSEARAATDKPVYVLCKMGPRAEKLCQLMTAYGQDNMIVVQGGITGCEASGAALEKTDPFPSMEEIQNAVQDSFGKFMMRHAT